MTSLKQANSLPSHPGIYIFRDQQGSALYVGKAINLKNRVRSYFKKEFDLGPKTALMVSKIKKIEHIVVESEIEALLLESDLIKRLKPKYNVQLKDDKAYKYISISKTKNHPSFAKATEGAPRSSKSEVGQKSKTSLKVKAARPEDYAKILTTRKSEGRDVYFGPFPEGGTVNQVLRTLRRIFPFRDCSEAKFKRYQKLGRPCLYGDLKLCPAPCVGRISSEDYKKIIKQLKMFLSGKRKGLVRELEREMKKASKEKDFEKAAALRDRIRNLEYVTQSFRQASEYLEHPDLLEDKIQKELEGLKGIVGLESLERIEAYDISNISGKYAAGSLVTFINGEPSKRDYRRFKIKTVDQADDVGMIKETLRRRLARLVKQMDADSSFSEVPDLILIDGGKAQVSAANEVLKEYGLDIPVLGLAKRFEEVVKSDLSVVRLQKDSPALHLLQRIRDEAHRFAVSYHRKLRSKSVTR